MPYPSILLKNIDGAFFNVKNSTAAAMVKLQPDGVSNLAAAITFVVVDSLAVVLRIISKGKTKYRFSSDDWWILCALLFFYCWAGLVLYSVAGIAGTLNVDTFTDLQELEDVSKILWVAELFFPLTITPIKISVLSLYRTIFATRNFRVVTYLISTLCGLWLFAGLWVIIFQCRPVRAVYDVTLAAEAHCIAFAPFVFTYELINALLDISILAMPIFVVRKLQLQTRRKVQVVSIFLMGGFVLITCVLRMVYSFNPKEPKTVPSYSRGILWSTVELGVALICACLPTYLPLVPKSFGLSSTVRSWYNSLLSVMRSRPRGFRGGQPNNDLSGYNSFDHRESSSMDKVHLTQAIGGERTKQHNNLGNSHDISVESRIEIV